MGDLCLTGLYDALVQSFGLDPDVMEEANDARSWCPAEATHRGQTDRQTKTTHLLHSASSQNQETLEAEGSVP